MEENMLENNPWTTVVKTTVTPTKELLVNLSIKVRTDQFNLFEKLLKPNHKSKILDVGVTSHEILKDSNIFERLYEFPQNITAATIEDAKIFQKLYPKIKTVQIIPYRRLPFENQEFDIVVSWATLEHVGDYKKQEDFINELLRVGKKVFITTPWRGCIYEPHSGFFFLHWLPMGVFRKICSITRRSFWSTSENLNSLYVGDIKKMKLRRNVKVMIYSIFKLLPSHIIIFAND